MHRQRTDKTKKIWVTCKTVCSRGLSDAGFEEAQVAVAKHIKQLMILINLIFSNISANHLPKNLTQSRKDAKFLIINDF